MGLNSKTELGVRPAGGGGPGSSTRRDCSTASARMNTSAYDFGMGTSRWPLSTMVDSSRKHPVISSLA